jgi:hypothetical protein
MVASDGFARRVWQVVTGISPPLLTAITEKPMPMIEAIQPEVGVGVKKE